MKICKSEIADIEVRTEPTIYFTYTLRDPNRKVPHITWNQKEDKIPKSL